ncbi:MAG: cyclic nucleotide-binding domain-containing protein [Ghiorsea sp.]|nr:cyclic nucleotide-binding domain-containing protein [Ghiorsea sp.]
MPETKALEKQLIQSLRKEKIRSANDIAALVLLKKVHALKQKNKHLEVAIYYAALAAVVEKDAALALQAARGYQKADDLDASARWFLITADRYANDMETSKSVAALRIYNQLKPEDKKNPKRIYEICLKHGADESNPPSILVSDADIAGSKLLASDFFETFDSSDFDQLLKSLTYHKLQDGDVITRMGDKASSLYIIISGNISGYLTLKHKRTYLGDMGGDSICGETAYFTGGKRTTEMIAKGETELFELPYSLLDQFKTELPCFNQRIEKLYQCRMLVKQLALTTLFEGVTAQCREWVAAKMKPTVLKKGKVLISQNEEVLDVYLLRKGKLLVTVNVSGKQRLLKTIETGGIVGETAIVTNKQRTATVTASTDCLLMKLDAKNYQTFYASSKPVQNTLEQLKRRHLLETFDLMKNNKVVEGDETCEILIKEIWQG